MSFVYRVRHVLFDASREGRFAEIVGWSNAIASVEVGAGLYWLDGSWPLALGVAIVFFVALRASLVNAVSIWIAAACGTVGVASLAGGLGWLFGHVGDVPSAPPIVGAVCAVAGAVLPAYAYAQVARHRADGVADSLVSPPAPPSRPSLA